MKIKLAILCMLFVSLQLFAADTPTLPSALPIYSRAALRASAIRQIDNYGVYVSSDGATSNGGYTYRNTIQSWQTPYDVINDISDQKVSMTFWNTTRPVNSWIEVNSKEGYSLFNSFATNQLQQDSGGQWYLPYVYQELQLASYIPISVVGATVAVLHTSQDGVVSNSFLYVTNGVILFPTSSAGSNVVLEVQGSINGSSYTAFYDGSQKGAGTVETTASIYLNVNLTNYVQYSDRLGSLGEVYIGISTSPNKAGELSPGVARVEITKSRDVYVTAEIFTFQNNYSGDYRIKYLDPPTSMSYQVTDSTGTYRVDVPLNGGQTTIHLEPGVYYLEFNSPIFESKSNLLINGSRG